MDEARFRQELREQGYGDAAPLEYGPHKTSEMHTHDFSCFILVLEGEFGLQTEQGTNRYRRGETFKLPAGVRHAELTGADGVKALLGKK